ncbi:MAG: hypothetical protein M3464_09935 [Chloroflexota bacterium]|nr:hypothetical protein [Chloroflexota bacterium]
MDALHFDQWTKEVVARAGSRREMLRLGLGGGLAALVFGRAAGAVAACRGTGKQCDKNKQNGGCCSGTCKKGKCRRTPGAAGCTVDSGDSCVGQHAQCPNNPDGFCIRLDNGKPFCYQAGVCAPCTSDASCTLRPNGKCLMTCPACQTDSGDQACVYPPLIE